MKQIKYALIVLLLSLAALSCVKTSDGTGGPLCEDVECKNNGSCVKGNCVCDYGWKGSFCEIRATGAISFFNNTGSRYKIEINNVDKGILAPHTQVYHEVEIGTYSCKVTEQRTDTIPPIVRSYDNVKVFPSVTKPVSID